MTTLLGAIGHRGVRLLDGFVLFWVLLWIVLGLLTGHEVQQLTSVSDSAQASARAADSAGQALQSLRDLPLVGGDAGELGDQVRDAAQAVLANAADSRVTIHRLGVLLGISIALIPLTPVLWLYLPPRLVYRADVAALRARLASGPPDDALTAYLARRAVDRLPYRQLSALTEDPVGDLRAGRHAALARAELGHLGLAS
ncbi:hypothetical protein E4P41_14175 [Geodermatophilus sp. DF01-2]|uniref:hypothetical protein n=1 Tax=Geodermatophilus sp. DF01-2 TaxID=2559610 RepID=UPI0010749806|nr:hypothetical protein [Geodermatophilus sp. DF01_2]TFV57730.1 hypothetical protein E4P41_14175 [Geodermatophilus sp. DF01_2]